jgi:hypothetical protein
LVGTVVVTATRDQYWEIIAAMVGARQEVRGRFASSIGAIGLQRALFGERMILGCQGAINLIGRYL